jgi:hypothetical protein
VDAISPAIAGGITAARASNHGEMNAKVNVFKGFVNDWRFLGKNLPKQ